MAMRDYAPSPGGRGDPSRPPGPHRLRIGDAERDAATADLGEHYAAGRLTLDELHERVDAVLAAKTFGQLAAIMQDLPGPGRLPWDVGPGGYWRRTRTGFQQVGGWDAVGLPPAQPAPADRSGRFAALALLLLAMLIWLFTALLFVRHGFYHEMSPVSPTVPIGHMFNPGAFNQGG
jgi:hypothetical protein